MKTRQEQREEVKKKIKWYCRQMRIPEPRVWDYASVLAVSEKINVRGNIIMVCRDCGKIDVSYEHACGKNH